MGVVRRTLIAVVAASVSLVTFAGPVHGAEDVTPPEVVSGSVSPSVIDTSTAPATVAVSITVKDDLSGVRTVYGILINGAQVQQAKLSLVSGNEFLGVWSGEVTIPANAAYGQWSLRASVWDNVRNPASLSVTVNGVPVFVQNGDSAPSAPRDVRAVAGNGYANVSWSPPASTGGQPVTRYAVASSPAAGTCLVTAPETSCIFTGLTNGTSYTFTVTASNSAGTSPASSPSAAVMPAGPPSAPLYVRAFPADGEVKVDWTQPFSNGGAPITSYTVTASPGGNSCTAGLELVCTVTGLTNGVAYTFVVTATNAAGTSPPSSASRPVTPTRPVTRPGAVADLKAISLKGAVRFTWKAPSDLGGASTVQYEYRVGRGPWKMTAGLKVTVKAKRKSAVTFRVKALNEAGAGPVVTSRAVPKGRLG